MGEWERQGSDRDHLHNIMAATAEPRIPGARRACGCATCATCVPATGQALKPKCGCAVRLVCAARWSAPCSPVPSVAACGCTAVLTGCTRVSGLRRRAQAGWHAIGGCGGGGGVCGARSGSVLEWADSHAAAHAALTHAALWGCEGLSCEGWHGVKAAAANKSFSGADGFLG